MQVLEPKLGAGRMLDSGRILATLRYTETLASLSLLLLVVAVFTCVQVLRVKVPITGEPKQSITRDFTMTLENK